MRKIRNINKLSLVYVYSLYDLLRLDSVEINHLNILLFIIKGHVKYYQQ